MSPESTNSPTVLQELKGLLPERKAQIAWLVLAGVFVWFYWSSLETLLEAWYKTEDYQHGFVVPIFSIALLWLRRDMIPKSLGRGHLWGLAFFVLWAVMRWTAVYFNYGSLPELSMLPFFAGVALFVGGWQGLNWAWPSIFFLFFMIPLPGAVQGLASEQLQRIATYISTFVIQTLGIAAVAQGNVIQLAERPLEVARACSGLRMMMLFFALCIGAAFVTKRPLWEKLTIIASAAPIAVLSNVIRIVLTAIAYEAGSRWPSVIDLEQYGSMIHDWAGYLMMPIGLLLLLAETTLMSKLMVEPVDQAVVIGSGAVGRRAATETRKTVPVADERRPADAGATQRLLQRRRR
jgi:exosortase